MTLYRQFLSELGFVMTRSFALNEAVKKLHMAVCMLDEGQFQIAENKLLDLSVKELISKFGEIEELRRKF